MKKIIYYLKIIISILRKEWRPKFKHERIDLDISMKNEIYSRTMLSEVRLANIKSICDYIHSADIIGDYIECGVWKGGSVGFAAYSLMSRNNFRVIHLLDSFEGICQPNGNIDGEKAINDAGGLQNAQGKLEAINGVYDSLGGLSSDLEVFNFLTDVISYPKEQIKIHKGWFQNTLPIISPSIDTISILRLDGDWYESTKICLDFLYPKVSKGGVIIVDDYNAYDGCKKAVSDFLKENNLCPLIVNVDDECVFWLKV